MKSMIVHPLNLTVQADPNQVYLKMIQQNIRNQSELDIIGVLGGFGQNPAHKSARALPENGQLLISQSNGALLQLGDFPTNQFDEAQAMPGQYPIDQSIVTHTELRSDSGCDWNNDLVTNSILQWL
jgi:hypothetical protein